MLFKHQIINYIIDKYSFENYLEVGVRYTQDCFDFINCPVKHSVDPGYENPLNPAIYPFTSDSFFTQLEHDVLDLPPNYKWDVILIDGLHLSYQVEKDILNSLNHLSENGFIILHDCNPFLTEDSYTRVIEDYWGQMWNGTVWKAVYKLRATRSDLDVCTLNIDEGVGLVRRGHQELVPFDNPFFEYRIFQKNLIRDLNLIDVNTLDNWLNK